MVELHPDDDRLAQERFDTLSPSKKREVRAKSYANFHYPAGCQTGVLRETGRGFVLRVFWIIPGHPRSDIVAEVVVNADAVVVESTSLTECRRAVAQAEFSVAHERLQQYCTREEIFSLMQKKVEEM